MNKPPSKYVSHNPYRSEAQGNGGREIRRNSSRGKLNSQKSGKMLHYQEYMRKMYDNQMRRKQSQKRIVNGSRKSIEDSRVYRSRVSSADVQRDNVNKYKKMYGYKPKPLWFG
jgi:hypothetical protein